MSHKELNKLLVEYFNKIIDQFGVTFIGLEDCINESLFDVQYAYMSNRFKTINKALGLGTTKKSKKKGNKKMAKKIIKKAAPKGKK